MRRLTSLDAFFLATEDARTVANVSALAILERKRANGRRLTRHAVKSLFAQRLHLLPPLRWQLAEVPLALRTRHGSTARSTSTSISASSHCRHPATMLHSRSMWRASRPNR
jgi:Wax ester synthase-like Acyl-CoA acyltransferase domain